MNTTPIRSTVMVLMEDLKNFLSLEREVSGKNPFSEDFPQKAFLIKKAVKKAILLQEG